MYQTTTNLSFTINLSQIIVLASLIFTTWKRLRKRLRTRRERMSNR